MQIMAVLRIHKKQQNFVILDKSCLHEKSLSWAAKGLHAYLISLPDDWRVQVDDLMTRSTNGRDSVRKLLQELEQAGYIKKSSNRDKASGRFGGIEYLVLEVPEANNPSETPSPEKPSSGLIVPDPEIPAPENPSLAIPAPEKATLLNNKYNNYLNNQGINKTAANNSVEEKHELHAQPKTAAAVYSSQSSETKQVAKLKQHSELPVELLSHNDALIGIELTGAQKERLINLVNDLNVPQKELLAEEISFCLLNPKHFTACGNDFGRKLNAIRTVILRGDWQTPVGMVQSQAITTDDLTVKKLRRDLVEMQAEASHFKKLLLTAKDHTRDYFETIINRAQNKILSIEQELQQALFGASL